MTFNNFTGARIHQAITIRPATGRPVYPLDHVIAHIQWIGVSRQHLDLKCIIEASGSKCLIPPFGTI